VFQNLYATLYTAAALPPTGGGSAPPGVETDANTVISWITWIALVVCIAGFVKGCASLAMAKRHGNEAEGSALVFAIGGAVGIAAASTIITTIAA